MSWVDTFNRWSSPPSDTEEQKAENAAGMIRKAINKSTRLPLDKIVVYPTGSFRNRTNIRTESDIDIAVVYSGACYWEGRNNVSFGETGLTAPITYPLESLRADLLAALKDHFGEVDVSPGDITINICSNSNRLAADVTPFLEHRRYFRSVSGDVKFQRGVETRPVSNPARHVINWHEEHYAEGVSRNTKTARRFKRVTRILKRLRGDMLDKRKPEAESIPSFLLECLAFNAPDHCFDPDATYYENTRRVIASLWNATKTDAASADLWEVNRMKPLFGSGQAWTREKVNAFLLAAWQHAGFTS